MSALLAAVWAAPLAALLCGLFSSRWMIRLAPPAALVSAAVAIVWLQTGFGPLDLPWLFAGVRLGLDEGGAAFLFGGSLAWLMAALLAQRSLKAKELSPRFFAFFLAAMAGAQGACVAPEAGSFYTFYAVMGLAAWGLIDYHRDPKARRVATLYLAFALLGEALILIGLLFVATGISPLPAVAWVCLIAGFGIKTGLIGFGGLLPLIYHAAPVSGAMALSGAMAAVGFLGWLRFLPLGQTEPFWGTVLMALGGAGMVFGLLMGLTQNLCKAVLGYASVFQTGLLLAVLGAVLKNPAPWVYLAGIIPLYAVAHALIKALLFAASEYLQQPGVLKIWRIFAWLLAALIVAAPLTGMGVLKTALKLPLAAEAGMGAFFAAGSFGATLLMLRFFATLKPTHRVRAIHRERGVFDGMWLGLTAVFVAAGLAAPALAWDGAGFAAIAAALLLAGLWRLSPLGKRGFQLPPGDWLHPFTRL
ncbi:MAG: proton-conducting transporter membrane subunit [Campylobacterales bacterium]